MVQVNMVLSLTLVHANDSGWGEQRVSVGEVDPAIGWTRHGLRLRLEQPGRSVALSTSIRAWPQCKGGQVDEIEVSAGSARLHARELDLHRRCVVRSRSVAWRRGQGEAALQSLLQTQAPSEPLADRSPRAVPRGKELAPSSELDRRAQADRARSRARLRSVTPRLREVIEARFGYRFRHGATGNGVFIDLPHFVQDVTKAYLGVDPGSTLLNQLHSGRRVLRTEARPGDLILIVTRAERPRASMVYLGNNLAASVAMVRGVIVDAAPPPQINEYVHTVVVRPQ